MEYSLQSYLARQSTEELDRILNYCLQQEQLYDYEHVIRLVLEILWKREKDELEAMVPALIKHLNRCTEKLNRMKCMTEERKLHHNEEIGNNEGIFNGELRPH